jgi:hypothetical protein
VVSDAFSALDTRNTETHLVVVIVHVAHVNLDATAPIQGTTESSTLIGAAPTSGPPEYDAPCVDARR